MFVELNSIGHIFIVADLLILSLFIDCFWVLAFLGFIVFLFTVGGDAL